MSSAPALLSARMCIPIVGFASGVAVVCLFVPWFAAELHSFFW